MNVTFLRFAFSFTALVAFCAATLPAVEITPENREFFERSIRPILVSECYECHSTQGKQRNGLNLDHRDGLLQGGKRGAAIIPGKPEQSLLITAIKHARNDLKMPKARVKLSAAIVADFEKWIAMGAPDPRDAPPTAEELAAANDWNTVMEKRKNWWSFQPIANVSAPVVPGAPSQHEVDRFLYAKQQEMGLISAGLADKRTLIRRLSFVLTGLPPSPEAVEAFEKNQSPDAYKDLVDALLGSPEFGERWARHWMDWFRYAESHGSEGDPSVPFAWKYRDYLIRAFNEDIPYDQLIREHIAGDLLENPRIIDGANESALGTAHFRMVHHGFAPTDALDEMVRFTDNQIDVVTKGFLGLTVSCARCHNHKFDAISQADFYSLFGILTSCRPATLSIGKQPDKDELRAVMGRLKGLIRERLVASWQTESIANHLLQPESPWQSVLENATKPDNPLYAWNQLRDKEGDAFKKEWQKLASAWEASAGELAQQRSYPYEHRWRLGNPEQAAQWYTHGTGMPKAKASPAGEFHLNAEDEQVVGGVFPAGLISHAVTTRDSGVFESPKVLLDGKFRVFVRVAGSEGSLARYVVRHYPRNGTVYPVANLKGGDWRWQNWNLDYWTGDSVHCEIATAADSPVLGKQNADRSWVALSEVVFAREGEPAPEDHFAEFVAPLFEAAEGKFPNDRAHLAAIYAKAIRDCIENWSSDTLSDSQAHFLDFFVRKDLLPNTLDGLPSAAPLVAEFRELEAKLDAPVRAPGIVETEPVAQPLFNRGNHKDPGEPIPRRFLDAFGAREYPSNYSGRRELAEDIVQANPLAARVIANRLWHHVFGRGIVQTADNFGRLGSAPSHPELLDYLARRTQLEGWSLKKMISLLVTSRAFQLVSTPPEGASERDPDNVYLTHWKVRRLEAEAIRDGILAVSGRLESGKRFGPPANGDSGRRSVYVRVIRNNLDPFLSVFDAPVPNSTLGARQTSNVPAQSLTMMNDPFVRNAARAWAERANQGESNARERVASMFMAALGHPADEATLDSALAYVAETQTQLQAAQDRAAKLHADLERAREALAQLLDPVRELLVSEKEKASGSGNGGDVAERLKPIAAWDFADGTKDQVGNMHANLKGGAKIADGALVLDGESGYAHTKRLGTTLKAKTLEAWVELSTLDQGGGSPISIESPDGVVFDAIVYAEREPHRWMAGSNGFQRTKDFSGPNEDQANQGPVHVAITYDQTGTITGYRNGNPYGRSYKSKGPVTFEGGKAQVLFGLRHADADDGKLLACKIHRARLYDRALNAGEVMASYRNEPNYVSGADLDAALTDVQRERRAGLEATIAQLEAALADVEKNDSNDPLRPWIDLAHSILNLKEFIYLR